MVEVGLNLLTLRVEVCCYTGIFFTAKPAKGILIGALKELCRVFARTAGPQPKLVHVTPFYTRDQEGRTICIYSYKACKNESHLVSCRGPAVPVHINGDYYFYFGFHRNAVDATELLDTLVGNNGCFEFAGQRICYRMLEIEVQNPHAIGLEMAKTAIKQGGFKIVFSSPTMLRDPLRTKSKFKTYLPTPENVFAAPVYTRLHAEGRYTAGLFRRELLRLRRLFGETYSVLGSVRVRWVYYGREPEPALVGFVNYRLNAEYLEYLKQKGVNVEEWLGEILAYTVALGVGAGRAAGFGHEDIKPLGLKQAPEQHGG